MAVKQTIVRTPKGGPAGSPPFIAKPENQLNQFARIKTCVFFLKAVDSAGRVNQFLLAGEEGVALGTDFHLDIFLGGSHIKGGAAGTGRCGFCVVRMDIFFHVTHTPWRTFVNKRSSIN